MSTRRVPLRGWRWSKGRDFASTTESASSLPFCRRCFAARDPRRGRWWVIGSATWRKAVSVWSKIAWRAVTCSSAPTPRPGGRSPWSRMWTRPSSCRRSMAISIRVVSSDTSTCVLAAGIAPLVLLTRADRAGAGAADAALARLAEIAPGCPAQVLDPRAPESRRAARSVSPSRHDGGVARLFGRR